MVLYGAESGVRGEVHDVFRVCTAQHRLAHAYGIQVLTVEICRSIGCPGPHCGSKEKRKSRPASKAGGLAEEPPTVLYGVWCTEYSIAIQYSVPPDQGC